MARGLGERWGGRRREAERGRGRGEVRRVGKGVAMRLLMIEGWAGNFCGEAVADGEDCDIGCKCDG